MTACAVSPNGSGKNERKVENEYRFLFKPEKPDSVTPRLNRELLVSLEMMGFLFCFCFLSFGFYFTFVFVFVFVSVCL